MPHSLSHREYADMVLVYGFCNGYSVRSVGEYRRRFPNRRILNRVDGKGEELLYDTDKLDAGLQSLGLVKGLALEYGCQIFLNSTSYNNSVRNHFNVQLHNVQQNTPYDKQFQKQELVLLDSISCSQETSSSSSIINAENNKQRKGGPFVALNPMYEANELKYCLNKCEVKALVCSDVYKTVDFYGKLCTLFPGLESSSNTIDTNIVPTLNTIILISQKKLSGTYNYYDVLSMADVVGVEKIRESQNRISPDDICNIQFSSGTTGFPKAACLTHFQIVNNAFQCGKRIDMNNGQYKVCVQVPLFHVFGLVICIAVSPQFGITMVFPSPTYNSTANLNALAQEKCSMVCGTPTMFVDLCNVQKKLNKKIFATKAAMGGALCTPSIIDSIKNTLAIKTTLIAYGATETTALVFQSLVDDNEYQKLETVGYIGDYVEVKVVDNNGKIVPFGTPGELCVRGYLIMAGYWNEREKTKEAFYDRNWYRTGDQFILQEDGYGRIVGRVKEMIIRGGENIFPKEIEDFLSTHPDIFEVYVIGVKSERLGEEVCACVRIKPGSILSIDLLKEFCKGKIANYKIPTHLKVMESFPKTASGKIQKFLLNQEK